MTKKLIMLLVAALALAGCAADGEPDPVVEPVCITDDVFPSADEFVGLTEDEAIDLAGERGLEVREVGRDGECFPVTEDLRQDRINLEFSGDRVIAAARY